MFRTTRLRRIHRRLPGDQARMLIVAACIGLMTGCLIIAFRESVECVKHLILGKGAALLGTDQDGWQRALLPLLPMCGAALLIPFSLVFPGEINGYGLPRFLKQVNLGNGVFRARTIALKIAASALSIGSGNSAGVEGPIAQISGALGSQVGQKLRVSGRRMKVYIAAGCAGGIAGIFNAPLAGMFFAAEIVLLGDYGIRSFAALAIASAMSTVVGRAWFGEAPAFPIPPYAMVNPVVEVPLYTLMAVLAGAAAVVHIRLFYRVGDAFARLRLHPQLKPLLGAFLVGVIAIFFPQVMGDGYDYIARTLAGDSLFRHMAMLVVLKSLATALTLGSGGAGGVFAPALFIGAVFGGAFGVVVHSLLPEQTASPGAYATVGMGAFLAASTHAPLTALFLLFEMTGNSLIIVPAMIASVLGVITAKRLHPDSIDTAELSREGIDIHEGREAAILKSVRVGKAITEDLCFISEGANVNQLLELFRDTGRHFYFPVIGRRGLMTGVVSMQDVKSALLLPRRERARLRVGDICARDVIMLTPDASLHEAIRLFDVKGLEEIPVVESREQPWVLGMLKRQDLIAAYNHELVIRGMAGEEPPRLLRAAG